MNKLNSPHVTKLKQNTHDTMPGIEWEISVVATSIDSPTSTPPLIPGKLALSVYKSNMCISDWDSGGGCGPPPAAASYAQPTLNYR